MILHAAMHRHHARAQQENRIQLVRALRSVLILSQPWHVAGEVFCPVFLILQ